MKFLSFLFVLSIFVLSACAPSALPTATPTDAMKGVPMSPKLPDNFITPHFTDSAPAHGDVLKQAPDKLTLNFNFTLKETSVVTVEKDGKALSIANPVFGDKRLSMTAALPSGSGEGLYVVKYKACWPDNSCHNGQFGFLVDSKTGK